MGYEKNYMAIKVIQQDSLTWINIDQVNEEAQEYLRKNHNFHHLDLEDVQGESQTPKLDVYKNYLFLVLQFPHWHGATQTIRANEIDFFLGDDYLITVQHTKSKEMKNFFYRCMKNKSVKKEWMSHSSGFLLYQIVNALFRNSQPLLNNIGKQISSIENEIFEGQQDTDTIQNLAKHRRNIHTFRRILDPQRYLIGTLSHTRKPFLNEETSLYFDDVSDHLNKLWAIVDTYRDSINGLHVTVESLINQRTNKVISMLTVFSVALLPLTLLSGIYGMNISGLPFATEPGFVWGMFGVLALFIFAVIAVMRHNRWL